MPEGSTLRFDGSIMRTLVDPKKEEYQNKTKDSFAVFCGKCFKSIIVVDKKVDKINNLR